MPLLQFFKMFSPTRFFVVAALCLGISYNLVTPPLQAPDEFNHFYRALQMANGHFLPERTPNRLGGQLPVCLNDFTTSYLYAATNLTYTFDKKEIFSSGKVTYNDSLTEFKDFPNTAYYSPVSYLPQAFGIFIARQFGCTVNTLYYSGRWFAFIFWLVIMFIVIKTVPVYKWLFTLLALLPMNIYISNSFSADTVTNCLAFLFIAMILNQSLTGKPVTKKFILFLCLLIILLSLAKVVYAGLVILFLVIPKEKFNNNLQRFAGFFLIGILSLTCILLWSHTIMKYYITIKEYDPAHTYYIGISTCGDYYAQKEYILTHGFYFLKVIYHSIVDHPSQFLKGYIGVFGQSDIIMPPWIYVLSYVIILAVALFEPDVVVLRKRQKVILLLSAFLSFILLLLSQHLIWDCVGEGVVDLVQGRYLVPLFPLLFILLSNNKLKMRFNPLFFILPLLFLTNLYACYLIYKRFYVESFTSRVEFYCDFEKRDENRNYTTTHPEIKLSGGEQSNEFSVSGNHSGVLSPPPPEHLQYGFGYTLKDLKFGDLVEIEALEKGGDGHLVISGKGDKCGNFYMASKTHNTYYKPGWYKVRMTFTMFQKCDSTTFNFYVWNPGKSKTYFDDIKFSIKKF